MKLKIHYWSKVSDQWVWIFCRKWIWERTAYARQTNDTSWIPHFKSLDVGFKISQEQPYSSIRNDHATFLVKNTLFKEEVAWQPLRKLQSYSSSILDPSTRAFKWGLFVFLPSLVVEKLMVMSKSDNFHYIKLTLFDITLNYSINQKIK